MGPGYPAALSVGSGSDRVSFKSLWVPGPGPMTRLNKTLPFHQCPARKAALRQKLPIHTARSDSACPSVP